MSRQLLQVPSGNRRPPKTRGLRQPASEQISAIKSFVSGLTAAQQKRIVYVKP